MLKGHVDFVGGPSQGAHKAHVKFAVTPTSTTPINQQALSVKRSQEQEKS